MEYSIITYTPAHLNQWNDFISKSKNGTFLFNRDFMEYHNDRFEDFSLMVFDGNKLVALLPANKVENVLHSHQGLTYGGLVYNEKLKQVAIISIFKELLKFLSGYGIVKLYIKELPYIYHKYPSQEIDYALFLANAQLVRRDGLMVIENTAKIKMAPNRMKSVKKGIANKLIVKEANDFSEYWNTLLIPNLLVKHNVKPVHSLEEITLLKKQFPDNIKLFVVEYKGRIVAGTVLFETDTVAHAQYITGGEDMKELGSLDFLFYDLIYNTFPGKKYFDFGICNEQQGRKFNEGLAFWKESFGARTVVQNFYEVQTINHTLLNEVFI